MDFTQAFALLVSGIHPFADFFRCTRVSSLSNSHLEHIQCVRCFHRYCAFVYDNTYARKDYWRLLKIENNQQMGICRAESPRNFEPVRATLSIALGFRLRPAGYAETGTPWVIELTAPPVGGAQNSARLRLDKFPFSEFLEVPYCCCENLQKHRVFA